MLDKETLTLFSQLNFSVIAIVLLVTLGLLFSSYVKIVTVLGIVRAGIGVSSIPSAFVTGGIALSLSLFIMTPTISSSLKQVDINLKDKKTITEADRGGALEGAIEEWRKFVKASAGPNEVQVFSGLALELDKKAGREVQINYNEQWRILAPAFIVSELKDAFKTGLGLFLPFLLIDLLVITVLAAVGFDSLSPYLIALPLKLLLFVLVDGWTLLATNLIRTYSA